MNAGSSDKILEREIEAALAVAPSPEFMARVRRRIADAPAPPRSLHVRRSILAFSLSLTCAALFLVVAQRKTAEIPSAPAIANELGTAIPSTASVTVSSPKAARKPRNELRVLIDPDETAGFQHLLQAAAERQLGPSSLQPEPLKNISIEPIPAFEPITIEPITPGDQQE